MVMKIGYKNGIYLSLTLKGGGALPGSVSKGRLQI